MNSEDLKHEKSLQHFVVFNDRYSPHLLTAEICNADWLLGLRCLAVISIVSPWLNDIMKLSASKKAERVFEDRSFLTVFQIC
jgi:hypothetical protein